MLAWADSADNLAHRRGQRGGAGPLGSGHLAHALLSPYLNLGLLSPDEVCDAAEKAWRKGKAPLASVEGFVRQIIGWRGTSIPVRIKN